jgi:lysozyme
MLSGTDISHYQSSIPKGDFAILKATEGTSYNDPDFSRWWKALEGKLRGAYHFAHPGNDASSEADHFLRVVRATGLHPGDVLVLDHEVADGTSAAHCSSWARAWCARVEAAVGYSPVVYTFLSFAREGHCEGLGSRPLWIADPSAPVGHPRVPAPWKDWVMHQYSETGGIDHDVFKGTADDWRALGGLHAHPDPTPTTEDDMPNGLLTDGANAITPIALPQGRYKTIGFTADNGLQGLPPAKLRVAVHQGVGNWHTEHVTVDSAKGQTVIVFPDQAHTDGISVQREDDGAVHVGFEVS